MAIQRWEVGAFRQRPWGENRLELVWVEQQEMKLEPGQAWGLLG